MSGYRSTLRDSSRLRVHRNRCAIRVVLGWLVSSLWISSHLAIGSEESTPVGFISATRATLPLWHFDGLQPDADLGHSVASAGDTDADGFDDVILGAPAYDDVWTETGRVFGFRGGPTGLSSQPSWTARGDRPQAHFGDRVTSAGDVNGDAFADVLVTSVDGEACAYLFLGSAHGLEEQPAWSYSTAWTSWNRPPSIAGGGDLDSDGFCDVLVGSPWIDANQTYWGRVAVFRGASTGLQAEPDWIVYGSDIGVEIGHSVTVIGDTDADGVVDCAMGAKEPGWLSAQSSIVPFEGITAPIDPSLDGSFTMLGGNGGVGFGITGAGDVNGDGHDDLLASAKHAALPWQPSVGYAAVFLGGSGGLLEVPSFSRFGEREYDEFGSALAGGTDLNGDGFSDVIIGDARIGHSRALAFMGGASGVEPDPAWTRSSVEAGTQFGFSVAFTGSVDGESRPGVLIGSPGRDHAAKNGGRVELFDLSHSTTYFVPGDRLVGSWGVVGERRFADFDALAGSKIELEFAPIAHEARIRLVLRGAGDRVKKARTIELGAQGAKTAFALHSSGSYAIEFRLESGPFAMLDVKTSSQPLPDFRFGIVNAASPSLSFEAIAGSTCDVRVHREGDNLLFPSQFRQISVATDLESDLQCYWSFDTNGDSLFTGVPIPSTGVQRFRARYGYSLFGGPVEVTVLIHPPSAGVTLHTLLP